MDGLINMYLAVFKVWDPATSQRLLKAPDYATAARESIKAMHEQVGDLCFTADGITRQGLLVRHLAMPGKEAEGARIARFLAEDVSRDCFVNITEHYHPDAHVGKPKRTSRVDSLDGTRQEAPARYEEINRPVSPGEISSIKQAAIDAGL